MTNIQAINLLKGLEQSLDDYCELNDEGKTAFGMAITALELFGNSEQLPSAQPEATYEQVKEYCRRRCLSIVDNGFLAKYASLEFAQPEIIKCKDCAYTHDTGGAVRYCEKHNRYQWDDYFCGDAKRSGNG